MASAQSQLVDTAGTRSGDAVGPDHGPSSAGGPGGAAGRLAEVKGRDLLRGLFEASPDVLVVTDLEGTVLEVSPSVRDVLGWDPEELVGGHGTDLLVGEPDMDGADVDEDGLQGRVRTRVRHRDGHEVVIESTWAPVPDATGAPARVVSVSRDVTHQVELEEALREAVAAARDADTAKSRFLSRMSHELRTPLNAMLGFTQLLELDLKDAQHLDFLRRIRRAGDHLLELIDEVLDIARIEAGEMTLSIEPVELAPVVAEVCDLMRPLAQERDVDLRVDVARGGVVTADLQRLKQVLLNLLSNAVKYTPAGGRVSVTAGRRDGEWLAVAVHDTGNGLSEEEVERLFVPFDRIGEEGRSKGTGLGLPLARHLAEAMGGELAVDSTPGVGSTFTLHLPRDGQDVGRDDAARVTASAPTATVVYIEDNVANVRVVERLLARRFPNVQLVVALQGRLGWQLIRQHRPDLVLLDLHLPDINGFEVLDLLRADERTAATPAIVLTADVTRATERAAASRDVEVLRKPLDLDEVTDALHRLLAQPWSEDT